MKKMKQAIFDGLFMAATLLIAFMVNLQLQEWFNTRTLIPMIFVLGVFLISWQTQGYFWGILGSLISVLAVNYAFTYPIWAFDLLSPECLASAIIMLIVAIMTGTLTTKIKKQEKMKAEAEKERMRGNLLRAVSHDLRTPLTSIYGACSAILENYDQIPAEKQKKMLTDIQTDAQWLVRMVENLLSVTKVDQGSVRLTKHATVLEELIDALLVKFRKHYPRQQILVEIPDTFLCIPMDPMLIEQVLMNLLENAVFHAKGMEHLWLRVEVQGNKAVFFVEDDGCGVPEERLNRLFSGVLDSEMPTDTSRSSMGIGLSVCRTIIKAHGGEIWAKNRSQGGAQFRFTLDLEEDDHGEQ